MKTKDKIAQKEFDTVKTFRTIKEKISNDLSDMSFDQIKEYLKERSQKFQKQ